MRLVVANVVLFMFLDCIRRKLRNPWMPLAELLGSAEARLKNTGLHHMMSISINIDAVEQKSKLQLVAVTLLTANQLSQLLAHTHDRKLATGGYIVSPPNMVCVTALQGNILITSLIVIGPLSLTFAHLSRFNTGLAGCVPKGDYFGTAWSFWLCDQLFSSEFVPN